ncbi:DUF2169 domain-containing protein [Mesorhizobium sp. M1252]|uniref:DUF2169 family type VI secretion system accessory protein n=1 Tax=Mesorhizobium sp. M1252 TaxID=2957073 RepID=UPI0033357727
MSFAVWLENRTPFETASYTLPDADGQEVFLGLFSASFEGAEDMTFLKPAEEQLPVTLSDVPFGDPALSSTRYEADIAILKPGIDVIVNGTAYAPNGKPVREMQAGLKFGPLQKVLSIVGDRIYDAGSYSAPHPFTRMPIIYERAYGGTNADLKTDPRNPLGVGFAHARSVDPAVKTQAPNITYPAEPFMSPSDKPRPAGFGALGRGWQPRLRLAGTYDQNWIDNQWPLPPKDYDPRYNLAAPADQQLPDLNGSDQVTLIGLTPGGRWSFKLPRVVAPIRLIFDDRVEDHIFKADTIIIEPDMFRVTLKARVTVTTRRNRPALRELVFGHVTPALIAAKRKGKDYFALRGTDGTITERPAWLP